MLPSNRCVVCCAECFLALHAFSRTDAIANNIAEAVRTNGFSLPMSFVDADT